MTVSVDEQNKGLFLQAVNGELKGSFWIEFRNLSGNKMHILSSKVEAFEIYEKTKKEKRGDLVSITALAELFNIHPRTVTRLCEKSLVDYGKVKKANMDTLIELHEKLAENGHKISDLNKYKTKFETL